MHFLKVTQVNSRNGSVTKNLKNNQNKILYSTTNIIASKWKFRKHSKRNCCIVYSVWINCFGSL